MKKQSTQYTLRGIMLVAMLSGLGSQATWGMDEEGEEIGQAASSSSSASSGTNSSSLSVFEGLAFHAAAASGRLDEVRAFIAERREYIDLKESGTGSTALFYAAANGCSEIVQILLEAGANPSLSNYWNVTPFQVATTRGHRAVVQLLTQQQIQRAAQARPHVFGLSS